MNKDLIDIDGLYKSGNFIEVIEKTKKLIKKGQTSVAYYNLLGISLDNIGKSDEAEKYFNEAIKINSEEISHYSNLAKILIKKSKINDAEKILQTATGIQNDNIFILFEYGKLERQKKNFEKSTEFFEKVYKLNPKFPNLLILIGKNYTDIALETNNKKFNELAKTKFLESAKIFPENVDADYLLSELYDYSKDNRHQKIMLNKIESLQLENPKQKAVIYFALAKTFDDQKKYDQASEFLKMANDQMNLIIDKNVMLKISRKYNNIKHIFENFINFRSFNHDELYNKKLIFVVGMPRSGTTLVHQLLAAAKGAEGIGESIVIPSFFESMIFQKEFFSKIHKNNKTNKDYLIEISQLLGSNFDKVAKTEKKIIIDKNPSNFFWIGFLKLLFPNSKIIHCKRSLKDISLSVYKNMFGVPEMDWSYNGKNILSYIDIYIKMMSFWRTKYDSMIHDIYYESLISNKLEETKKLFSFCDLSWSEDIFEFYKTGKTIRTASVNQVKKPIYSTSVNLSDHYRNHIKFLEELDNINL